MITIKEMLPNDSFINEDGDVMPYADIKDDLDARPASDTSIAQGMANLENWRKEQAQIKHFEAVEKWDKLHNIPAGPSVTLEQYRQDLLDLVDFVSNSMMRRGFENGGSSKREVRERYGTALPDVEVGAHRNLQKNVHRDLPTIYHADELIAAGFEPQEVMFDAKTTMRIEVQNELGGPSNKNRRAAFRRQLRDQ